MSVVFVIMSDEEQRLLSSIWDEEVDDSNEPNSISKRATALPIGLKIYIIILHILLVVVTCLAVTMSVHHRPTWKVSTSKCTLHIPSYRISI